MIDIETFRSRIGRFCQVTGCKKSSFFNKLDRNYQTCSEYPTYRILQVLIRLTFIAVVIANKECFTSGPPDQTNDSEYSACLPLVQAGLCLHEYDASPHVGQDDGYVRGHETFCRKLQRKLKVNFLARYTYGNKQNLKGVKNFHINIRSLMNKVSEVKNILKEHQPHVLGISECELNKFSVNFEESKLKVPGYNLVFPRSWSTHGHARVVTYVKKTLQYEQLHDLQNSDVQSIWLRAGFHNSKKLYICHAYREHLSNMGGTLRQQRVMLERFLIQWGEALIYGSPNHEENEVHISGDINLDALNNRWLDPSYPLITLSNQIQSTCNSLGFSQLVTVPTRSQHNSVNNTTAISCIDHVYTNRKFRCSKVTVYPFGGSDHDILGYTRYSKVPPAPSRAIRKRSYKDFKNEEFLQDLRKVDWTEVYNVQDVDSATATFTQKFVDVLSSHAPWIVYQERKHYKPWVTEKTKDMIKARNDLKKKAVDLTKSGDTDGAAIAWREFKKIRNQVNNRTRYEERIYKSEKLSQNLDSPANTWRLTKSFMDWKQSGGPPHQLIVNGQLITKAGKIASEINNYFIMKVKLIRQGIAVLGNQFTKCKEVMDNKDCKLSIRYVSLKKVNKMLKNLKNSRSTSIDELDNFCVKLAADIIDKPLHHIITLSLMSNRFPNCWKYSRVIPLHKKESTLECKNYRPVAILSPLSKILEKVVYEQLYNYFTINKIFHPNLHGYRHGRSTQTALMTMYDRWVKAAVDEQVSGVIFLDLSAAFDLVDPDLLLGKLEVYGIDREGLQWIHSYLTDRHQAVWVDHVFSEFLQCDVGVPQGSILGPLLFLIYFNDLPSALANDVDSYADDTTITATGKTAEEISQSLTRDCALVSDWMRSNRLKLNPDKTHLLTVGTAERLRHTNELDVTMDNIRLQQNEDNCEQLLGCRVQANLKWKRQTKVLISKLKTRLAGLAKLKFALNFPLRKIITEGIFNSVMVYCLPLFGGMDIGDLKDLQIMQNRAAQIVTHSPPRAHRSPMYDQLQWLTVNQLIFYHSVITIFKIRKSGEPEHLAGIFSQDSRNRRILIPNWNLSLGHKSFRIRGSENWNMLPLNVRTQPKVGIFKKQAKKWIMENVQKFQE